MLTTALRPAGIIGERDGQTIARMYDAYKTGKTGFQLGENNNIFDFTYVVNVAHAHLLAAVALLNAHKAKTPLPEERKVEGEVFFITNDQPTYFWDFSRAVWKVAGDKKSINPTIIPQNVGLPLASVVEWMFWILRKEPSLNRKMVKYSCMTRYYNVGKAKDRLGYKPIVSLPEGIERTVKVSFLFLFACCGILSYSKLADLAIVVRGTRRRNEWDDQEDSVVHIDSLEGSHLEQLAHPRFAHPT
jgi:sterol-4alpha-carboxylate 3-dehydrogenase (decarboxylating)